MRGHYACPPACQPASQPAFGSLIPGRYHLRKKPPKKGGSKQIFTLSKALGNSEDASKDWRKKSLFFFSCLSCLTCTATCTSSAPLSLLCLTWCHMRLPHLLLYYSSTSFYDIHVLNRSLLRHHHHTRDHLPDRSWMDGPESSKLEILKKRTKRKVYLRTMQAKE
jgi:hypothetical protein